MQWSHRGLRYFWTVGRLGTLRRAAKELHVSEPAVSIQLRKLQRRLGVDLFEKRGRRLELTPAGRLAFDYADRIFRLGDEMGDALHRGADAADARLTVGITQGIPKMLVQLLLAPVVEDPDMGLVVLEGRPGDLVGDLVTRSIDVIIADGAIPADPGVNTHSHFLGACGISFFATPGLAARLPEGPFPERLDGAPWLLPAPGVPLRHALDVWLARNRVHPRLAAEFDDSALVTAFGTVGDGVFPAPTAVEAIVASQYQVEVLGRTTDIRESFFSVSMEPRVRHPGLLAIEAVARELFPTG